MAKTFNLSSEVRGALRLIFRRSPLHKQALQKARVEKQVFNKDGRPSVRPAVFYKCDICKEDVKITHVEIDHIDPVGPAPGTRNAEPSLEWTEFINRVFCSLDNLRAVCRRCHAIKTKQERNKNV